jgi:glycosyltransferase involved in cell wall biosynthesis
LTPQLSIVIPTYNRKEILLKGLASYLSQTAEAEILEILVIDDGSTDGTVAAVAGFALASPITIRCLANPQKGPASARNYGIQEAKGVLILLGDDDIIPSPTLVAEHVAWNRKYPADNFAIMGHVSWSPEVHPTPFMEWLGLDGVLFGFRRLTPGKEVSFQFSYFCNTSVKRDFLIREGMFDEDFRGYGSEDTELGYRLINRGFHLLYNPDAIGYHHKHFSYADACRRQELMYATRVFLDTTEAGQALIDQASRAKPLTLKRRLMLEMAKVITPFLAPLVPLLDTQVRLPRIVYSLLYFFYIAPKAQARFERDREEHLNAKVT